MQTKKCLTCGNDFVLKKITQKYCSRTCYNNYRFSATCSFCGRKFETGRLKAKCCSRECATGLRKQNRVLLCEFCGKPYHSRHLESKFCSSKCAGYKRRNRKTLLCKWCKKPYEVRVGLDSTFCCNSHKAYYYLKLENNFEVISEPKTTFQWSREFSYIIGLIATDGYIDKDHKLIGISSKDFDFLSDIRDIICELVTGIKCKICLNKRIMNGRICNIYSYRFTSKELYCFCLRIGLMPRKSLILGKIDISKKYFSDFLRAVIDGDGNYNIHKRYLNGHETHYLTIRIFSGALSFIEWINETIQSILNISGTISNYRSHYYVLYWSNQRDCNQLISYMYSNCDTYLKRKWIQLQLSKSQFPKTMEFIKNHCEPIQSNLNVNDAL